MGKKVTERNPEVPDVNPLLVILKEPYRAEVDTDETEWALYERKLYPGRKDVRNKSR